MELLIAQARKQFDDILSHVQGEAQNQQLNEVEKSIFYSLLKLGLTILFVFFNRKVLDSREKFTSIKKEQNAPITQ